MIKVNVTKIDDLIVKVSITGHANYAEYGSDIVCSAVSAIGVGTVNAINEVLKIVPKCICKEGHLEVQFETDEKSQLIAQTMLVQLKSIEDNYRKYIKIKYLLQEVL